MEDKNELVSDIAVMAVCAPQKYKAYLADSRSIVFILQAVRIYSDASGKAPG